MRSLMSKRWAWPVAAVLLASWLVAVPFVLARTELLGPKPADRPAARAAALPQCTITGTNGDDVLVGTSHDDIICGKGGDDD